MRVANFRGNRRVELEEVPGPEPGEGELVIDVAACGVCGSERHVFEGGYRHTPGHEVVGTVARVGPGCDVEVGTRVAVYIPVYCGECELCRRGKTNLCRRSEVLLGWRTDGGYADKMLLPAANALPLEDGLSFEEGVALLDTLGTSGHGIRLAGGLDAHSALVIGAGPVGMGAVVWLTAIGVSKVIVSEMSPYRRGKAEELGAVAVDPEQTDVVGRVHDECPLGVDVAVEAAGKLSTIWDSLDALKPGGAVSVLGEYHGPIELEGPRAGWMINDLTLIRSFYFTLSEFRENQRMVLEGSLPAEELCTHTFPLERIEDAFELFFSGNALKVIVEP